MSLLIPVLQKDENWKQHREKLQEEFKELDSILENKDDYKEEEAIANIVEEALDVIQVCVGIIYKALETHRELVKKKVNGHIAKLINRGWKFTKILRVEED